MYLSNLRAVGGSIMMALPKAILDAVNLGANAKVGVSIENGKILIEPNPRPRPRYTLEELVAQCDPDTPLSDEDRAWLDDPPVGREII